MLAKDKRELKSLASQMPSVVQIGKDGLSNAVIDSARAAITARELIKAHVLNNANIDTKETMQDLADMLGAELVQVIGHYGILFKKKNEKSHYEFVKDE
ncbi:MAG: YhbY family RNA-binding protein [Megasphaera sp.]|nr:YhbY family RNA-binding protein [Megasphaera sp.]MCI1247418.1 YhbY family RNA-binding protein [Megasphaera sp.]